MTGTRIKNLRIDNDLKQKELAQKIGITQAALSQYENGDREPNAEMLRLLSKIFNVSIDYILGNDLDDNIGIIKPPKMVKINVLGRVPAGIAIEAIEDIIDTIEIPKDWTKGGKEYVGLLVTGDSMEPKYMIGDIIIVQVQPECHNGQDAVVYINGYDAVLKTVKRTGSMTILQSYNPKYPPMTFGANDEPVKIFGVVRRLVRDI